MKKKLQSFLFSNSLNDNIVIHIGWLLFRLHIGLSLAIHAGLPKMQEGLAPDWFIKQVGELGFTFPTPGFWATLASWGEFVGGLFVAVGLLSRFMGLQLVFQFFVISFLWYDSPEPLTGMYFQQTLFWGYALVVFLGGGKYSLDALINKKYILNKIPLIKPVIAVIILLTGSVSTANAQTDTSMRYDFKAFEKNNIEGINGEVNITVDTAFSVNVSIDHQLAGYFSISEKKVYFH
jgi:uncharacterized membrane protein YphA (DoxX/SURF4 family)